MIGRVFQSTFPCFDAVFIFIFITISHIKMLGKLPHTISGKKLLCATTISSHYHRRQCMLIENPIRLYTGRMLMEITKFLSA